MTFFFFIQRKSSKAGTHKIIGIYSTEAGNLTLAVSTVLMLQWNKNSRASQVLDTAIPGGKVLKCFNAYMQTAVNPV